MRATQPKLGRMFDIGFGEMLLLGAIALIAIGPKQLPEVLRTVGRFVAQARKVGGELQRNLMEAGESSTKSLLDVQKSLENVSSHAETITKIQSDVRAVAALATSAVASAQAAATAPVGEPTAHAANIESETPQLPLAPTYPSSVALDEHKQMSFDFNKNES